MMTLFITPSLILPPSETFDLDYEPCVPGCKRQRAARIAILSRGLSRTHICMIPGFVPPHDGVRAMLHELASR